MIALLVASSVLAGALGFDLRRSRHAPGASTEMHALAAASLLVVGSLLGRWIPVVVATVSVVASIGVVVVVDHRRRRVAGADVADFLEGLARSMRSGSSPRQAMADVAAETPAGMGVEAQGLVERIDRGLPLAMALRHWPSTRPDVVELAPAAVALELALASGGSAARAIDDVADTIRGQAELRAEVRALASQAQASALLIAVLPVGFALVAGSADPATLRFLVVEPLGRACLAVGLGLDALGLAWMVRIVRGVGR